ncbi:MAG: type II toxin-antitoxin system RelE/ParE family toxin [Endomicrobia bacterium]|nr:type II toxin-antitoxin system RelE/ParE family toxin [Endomicrobiia bacterium]
MNKKYKLVYLPLFEEDLSKAVDYISKALKNQSAALKLIALVEKSILKRLSSPLAFEPYNSLKDRNETYYRIYVKNFTVFYVIIGDTMEVRRFIYSKRQLAELI